MKTKCVDCKKQIEHNSGFPQDSEQWSSTTHVRCAQCWDKHAKNKLIPSMHSEEVRAKKTRQLDRVTNVQPKGTPVKRKRKRRLVCRCGSTSHVSIRHHLCPLNKKNVSPSSVDSATHAAMIVATREAVLAKRAAAAASTVVTPPQTYQFPEPPTHPLKKRPGAKDLVGRTFRDENHYDSNGNIEFRGGSL